MRKLGWTETTEMMKNVKKKGEEENWRIWEEIAGSEMEEKREEEWIAATRKKEGHVKEYWGNYHRQWCNWDMKGEKGSEETEKKKEKKTCGRL